MAHPELGFQVVEKVKDFLAEHIVVQEEKKAAFEGRNIIMILAPSKKSVKKPSDKDEKQKD